MSNDASVWYYKKETFFNPVEEGPFTEDQLKQLAKSGDLKLETEVMSPDKTKGYWVHAAKFKPLALLINQAKIDSDAKKAADRQQKLEEKAVAKRERDVQRQQLAESKAKAQQELAQAQALAQQQADLEAQKHRQQMQLHQAQAASNAPPQPQVVVINNQQNSNLGPVLLSGLLWPGLGQLVQGRTLAGVFLIFCWLASLLSIFVFIGLLLAPMVWLIAVVDAALYKG